jgi:transcription antitermination factor NusG
MMSKHEMSAQNVVCTTSADTPNFAPHASLTTPDHDGNTDAAYDGLPRVEIDDDLVRWYPLRIRHSNVKKAFSVREELYNLGLTSYLRMEDPKMTWDGEVEYGKRPAVTNLIFVKAKKKIVRLLKTTNPVCISLQFIAKPKAERSFKSEIIYIAERDMQNFIDAETRLDPNAQRIPLTYSDFIDKQDRRVRILRGPFTGIEGEVKRIQGHRIVVVLLRATHDAIGITHIAPKDLELLDDDE